MATATVANARLAGPAADVPLTARSASATDAVSFEQFVAAEQLEMDDAGDDTKQNLGACIAAADAAFSNDGSLEDLHAQVQAALARLDASDGAQQ